jgi:hypothetical protein
MLLDVGRSYFLIKEVLIGLSTHPSFAMAFNRVS